jgi:ribonuclease P protein component
MALRFFARPPVLANTIGHVGLWCHRQTCPVRGGMTGQTRGRPRRTENAGYRSRAESGGGGCGTFGLTGRPKKTAMQWTFPRHLRLRRQAEFDRVYQRRMTAADRMLIVHADASSLPHPRLGLSVSRKVGSAVVRNRWKRLIREAFRLAQHDLPKGIDLVVRPQAGAEPALEELRRSLTALAWRLARRLHQPRTTSAGRRAGESASPKPTSRHRQRTSRPGAAPPQPPQGGGQ